MPAIPAEPLPYHTASNEARRPGILTAIGVISIVLASFGLLIGAAEVLQTLFTGIMSQRVNAAMSATVVVSTAPGAGGTVVGNANNPSALIDETASRMSAPNRQMVVAAFNRLTPLSLPRQQMLQQLLASVGDDLLPFAQSSYTPERISSSISESGRLPTAGDQKEGNQFFVLANGRIEIGDDQADFTPVGRGKEAIHVSRPAINASITMPAFPTSLPIGIPRYSNRTVILSGVSGVLNTILAAYLLTIGIMMLRDSRRGRTLHLIYVPLKFLLILLAGWVSWLWINDGMSAFVNIPGTGAGFSYFMLIRSAIMNLPGCIYVIALLIVFNTSFVREYYRSWGTGRKS